MEAAEAPEIAALIKLTDARFNDLYTNRALAALSGYAPEELERIGWMNIIDPPAQLLFEEIAAQVDRSPYVCQCFDTSIVCRDGSTRTLAWEVHALAPDQFPLMLILARPAPRKPSPAMPFLRTASYASTPRMFWQAIFEALPACVSLHDAQWKIIAANRALCERLNVERGALLGRNCFEVFHNRTEPPPDCVLAHALSSRGAMARRQAWEAPFQGVCQLEAVAFESGSSVPAVLHVLHCPNGPETAGAVATRDAMDALSRLANALGHDYNNLLGGIVGYAGMLEMLPDLPPRALRYLGELQKAIQRLTEANQRLLLFGRRAELKAQSVDLETLLADTVEQLDPAALGVPVHQEKSAEPVVASGDPGTLRLALQNLIVNAAEATAARKSTPAPEVVLRAFRRSADRPFPTYFALAPAGEYAGLEVRDQGVGIEPAMLAHLFEPFSHQEFRSVGRGLGLAIVYRVVQTHKGFIEIETTPGAGTRLAILLPIG